MDWTMDWSRYLSQPDAIYSIRDENSVHVYASQPEWSKLTAALQN